MKSIKNSQKLTDSWVAANRERRNPSLQYLLPGRAVALLDGIGPAACRRRCLVPAGRAAAGLRPAVGVLLRCLHEWRRGSARPARLAEPARRAPWQRVTRRKGRPPPACCCMWIDCGNGSTADAESVGQRRPAPPFAAYRPGLIPAWRRAVLRRVVLCLARGNK